jgi:hypothetical protein
MSERDQPWKDVPADSDVVPGTEEPDPAEVEGDEGEEVDVSHRRIPDVSEQYRRETLDERLAEEVPDRIVAEDDLAGGDIMAAESGEDDIALDEGEPDENDDDSDWDDESAEEAAIHIEP